MTSVSACQHQELRSALQDANAEADRCAGEADLYKHRCDSEQQALVQVMAMTSRSSAPPPPPRRETSRHVELDLESDKVKPLLMPAPQTVDDETIRNEIVEIEPVETNESRDDQVLYDGGLKRDDLDDEVLEHEKNDLEHEENDLEYKENDLEHPEVIKLSEAVAECIVVAKRKNDLSADSEALGLLVMALESCCSMSLEEARLAISSGIDRPVTSLINALLMEPRLWNETVTTVVFHLSKLVVLLAFNSRKNVDLWAEHLVAVLSSWKRSRHKHSLKVIAILLECVGSVILLGRAMTIKIDDLIDVIVSVLATADATTGLTGPVLSALYGAAGVLLIGTGT